MRLSGKSRRPHDDQKKILTNATLPAVDGGTLAVARNLYFPWDINLWNIDQDSVYRASWHWP